MKPADRKLIKPTLVHRRTPLKSNNEHHAKLYFRTPLKAQKLATCCIQKQLKESYAIECREIGYEGIFHCVKVAVTGVNFAKTRTEISHIAQKLSVCCSGPEKRQQDLPACKDKII